MALNHSVSFVLALSAVLVVFIMVGCGSEPKVLPTPVIVPTMIDVAPQTSELTAQPKTSVPSEAAIASEPTVAPEPTPTPWITVEGGWEIAHPGAATALVEERILVSDVVVKARLSSTGEDVLNFRALQYLKGTGPQQFSVSAETEGRPTRWDNQDAVLFLKRVSGGSTDFTFADTTVIEYGDWDTRTTYTGDLPEGYTADTRNPVWLPVESSGGGSSSRDASGSSSGSTGDVIAEYDSEGQPETISQADLREAIAWVSGPTVTDSTSRTLGAVTKSGTPQGGDFTAQQVFDCVLGSLAQLRRIRDFERYFGHHPFHEYSEFGLSSMLGKGVEVYGYKLNQDFGMRLPGNQRYDSFKLTGRDADLFLQLVEDDDDNSRNGYSQKVVNRRPLPAGEYGFEHWLYPYRHKPCGYRLSYKPWRVTVTSVAPPGTVHEAFFDPATTTSGVGYLATTSTSTGVLEPAGFSVRGRAITITGLTWQNGRVVLTLDRFGSWLDGFSFIEPDGTVGLRLAEVDATKDWTARTLTWEVSEQPWEPGDELMMRMGPIPLPAVRNLTAEANSAGEVVLRWEVAYRAGVSGYRIWRHRPGRDEGPRIYVSDTLSTDTTYTDANSPVPNLTEYRVQAIDRIYNAGESSESVRVGSQ